MFQARGRPTRNLTESQPCVNPDRMKSLGLPMLYPMSHF